MRRWVTLLLLPLVASATLLPAAGTTGPLEQTADPVVVATFDTGTNPFHPCFRRPGLTHPHDVAPQVPASSLPLELSFLSTYDASLAASGPVLDGIRDRTLYHIPDTNLMFYGAEDAAQSLVDDYPHGAQASSQIACEQYGLAPNSILLVLNWYDEYPAEQIMAW